MRLEPRHELIAQIMALPESMRLQAYLDVCEKEREAHNENPPVVMCGCSDWMTCAHAWPERMFV